MKNMNELSALLIRGIDNIDNETTLMYGTALTTSEDGEVVIEFDDNFYDNDDLEYENDDEVLYVSLEGDDDGIDTLDDDEEDDGDDEDADASEPYYWDYQEDDE